MRTIYLILFTAIGLSAPLTSSFSAEAETSPESLLLRQLDEERLAYQLYTELGTAYPELRQFQNIPRAESRHFNALANYTKTKYPATEIGSLTGDFLYSETEALYQKLLKAGKQSPADALRAGVQVEELDIRDLDEALAASPEDTLRSIYENLRRGSENHLRAFSGKGGQGHKMQKGKSSKGSGNCKRGSCCEAPSA